MMSDSAETEMLVQCHFLPSFFCTKTHTARFSTFAHLHFNVAVTFVVVLAKTGLVLATVVVIPAFKYFPFAHSKETFCRRNRKR